MQLYAVWTNNKGLIIGDGEFLFLSCQHPSKFVPTDHPDSQKKFRMDCVIPYLCIFQTQRGHREGRQANYQESHLAPLPE